MHTGRTGRTTVRGTFRTTVGTTVMHTGRTGRTTVRGPLRTTISTAIGTAVMHTRCTRRTTIRGTFGATVGTTVMHTGRTGRTTVRGPLRTTISTAIGTAVMHTRCTRRTTIRGTLLPVRVLSGVSHHSSCESNGRDRAPQLASDRLTGDPGWALSTITVSLQDESLDSDRTADESRRTAGGSSRPGPGLAGPVHSVGL